MDSAPKSEPEEADSSAESQTEDPESTSTVDSGTSPGNLGGVRMSDFPTMSPVFDELATQEARQKRLNFLSNALAHATEDTPQAAKEPTETSTPKRQLEQLHNDYSGYAELGMSNTPEDILELPKLHPNRMFLPGATYSPQVQCHVISCCA